MRYIYLVAAASAGCDSEAPLPIADVHIELTGPTTVQEGQQATLSARLEGEPFEPVVVAIHTTAPDQLDITPSTFLLAGDAPVSITLATKVDVDTLDDIAIITAVADKAPSVAVDTTVVDRTRIDQAGFPATSDSRSLDDGYVYAWPLEIGSTVTLDKVGIARVAGGGPVRLALYRDHDGMPGTLEVGMNVGVEEVFGSFEADVLDHVLEPGHYWLAVRAHRGTSAPMTETSSSECIRDINLPNFLDPWPHAFGSSTCASGRPIAGVLWIRSQS